MKTKMAKIMISQRGLQNLTKNNNTKPTIMIKDFSLSPRILKRKIF
jgi:hypothetical protein